MGNGTSLGQVRGLGASHSGAHHWLMLRFTAISNLLLTVWLAVSFMMMSDFSYVTVHAWIARPFPAAAIGLLVISTIWHARLGLQVLFEDYVHEAGSKFACAAVLNLAAFGGGAFGVLCAIRLALGGA